ncbi:MAG: stage II sporulation protein M [Gemmatimonadales bacterium]
MTGPRETRGFTRRLAIETPESVIIELELAGLGSRFAAAIVDSLILVLLALVAILIYVVIGPGSTSGAWAAAIMVLVIFVIVAGYFALCEGLMNGQTPGKRQFGLRVVMDTGHPLTFGAAVSRNLVRIVDLQLGYLVGCAFIFMHPHHKRLGDIVAGTIVVRDRPHEQRLTVTAELPAAAPQAAEVPAAPAQVTDAPALTDEEYRLIEQFLTRRVQLEPAVRNRLAYGLVRRFQDQLPRESRGVETRLEALLALERARRSGAMAGARAARGGVASGSSRFVARRQVVWEQFRADALAAEQRGLRQLSGEALTSFAARYREVTADLARARTYGVDPRAVEFLERAVSAGHNALYGLRGVTRVPLVKLALRDLPRAVWSARGYVLVAFLLTAVPAAGGYALLRAHPERAVELLPDGMIARAEAGASDAAAGRGYAETPSLYLPIVATGIIANNVQVAFTAFALGITGGVGTIYVLFFNGLFLGAVVGLFANYGLAGWLFTFVAGHGVLELTAIFISGGAGLMIGRALIAPGDAPRSDALVVASRQAVLLVGLATLLLLLAGTIEGLLSASDAPAAIKFGVSAASAVLLALLALAGRREARSASS